MRSLSNIPNAHKLIAVACFLSAGWLLTTWIFAEIPDTTGVATETYRFVYDRITPWPDLMLGLLLLLTSGLLLSGKKAGRWTGMICAVYLLILGVIDPTINVQGKTVAVSRVDTATSGFINLWCVVLGLYLILKFRWQSESRNRRPSLFGPRHRD